MTSLSPRDPRTSHPTDYWMASDPQPCVADYLRGAPCETVYLVASKCHPAVFDALRDRRVVLWHCAEPGTLDGCYLADRDHAAGQPHHRGGDITVEVGLGRHFISTTSWAAEAQEAVRLFQTVPRDVTVHGDGMIAAILERFGLAIDSQPVVVVPGQASRR